MARYFISATNDSQSAMLQVVIWGEQSINPSATPVAFIQRPPKGHLRSELAGSLVRPPGSACSLHLE